MANVIINDTHLNNIANSIRNKNGTNTKYKPSEMATAISEITTSEDLSTELTEQNTLLSNQSVTIDDIKLALQNKSAGGGEEIVLQEKTITPTINQQNVVADSGYNGLSKVVVNAVDSSIDSDIKASNIKSGVNILGVTGTLVEGITPTGTLEITSNGTHDVTNYASANVKVPNEDLSNELTTQETLLNNQIDKLSVAINTLKNKASGGADTTEIEDAFITHTLSGDYANDRVTKVKYGTFYEDTNLTSVSFPNVTSVESYAFYKCTSLATIDIPQIKSASQYTFAYTKPSIINFPLLETISTYTFAYITVPCSVNLPSLKTTSNSSFRDSKGITRVDLAIATKIDTLCFYYCNNLEKLILRKSDAICTLQSTNAFTGTKIANGTGYIYVPDELVEEYKVATNWSNFASQIKGLSELEVVTNE